MRHAENAEDVTERVAEAQEELAVPAESLEEAGVAHGPAGHGGPPPAHTLG
jgi:hypothetical protein